MGRVGPGQLKVTHVQLFSIDKTVLQTTPSDDFGAYTTFRKISYHQCVIHLLLINNNEHFLIHFLNIWQNYR